MMTFKEHYEAYENYESQCFYMEQVGMKEGEEAVMDLISADQDEIYQIDGYYEGVHQFKNEDGTRIISVSFTCTAGVEFVSYMTIKDILDIEVNNSNLDFKFIQIQLYRDKRFNND